MKSDDIVQLYHVGCSGVAIKNLVRYPTPTVNSSIKHHVSTGSSAHEVHKPRYDKIQMSKCLAGLVKIVNVKGSAYQNDLAKT